MQGAGWCLFIYTLMRPFPSPVIHCKEGALANRAGEHQAATCMYLYIGIRGQQGAGLVREGGGRLQILSIKTSSFPSAPAFPCIEFSFFTELFIVSYVLRHSFCVDSYSLPS